MDFLTRLLTKPNRQTTEADYLAFVYDEDRELYLKLVHVLHDHNDEQHNRKRYTY